MSKSTKIEWVDHSWNPWRGCTKVSPGCANCYAEKLSKRNPAVFGKWGKGAARVLAKNWNDPVKWNHRLNRVMCSECSSEMIAQGVCCIDKLTRHKATVFPSLCDWLDEEVPIDWLVRFLQLIHDTPNIDWLLLTKRPQNWYRRMFDALLHAEGITDPNLLEQDPETEVGGLLNDWLRLDRLHSPKNVWVGTSVEDQLRADDRIPALLDIPAKLRFLSVEPLLGTVDLKLVRRSFGFPQHITSKGHAISMPQGIHWVIVGGESGPRSRPCNIDWIRSIVKQCATAGLPCFVKQLGANPVCSWPMAGNDGASGLVSCRTSGIYTRAPGMPDSVSGLITHPKGGDPEEWPTDLRMRQFPEVKP